MARVGFEHTIPAFERAKIFHALEPAATVIGTNILYRTCKKVNLSLGFN
jgi:hypothetical protein